MIALPIPCGGVETGQLFDSSVTAGAANTKSAWASLADPVARSLAGLIIVPHGPANASYLLDIGIGPSGGGSEQVLLPDLLISGGSTAVQCFSHFFPIRVPKGCRLSGRVQSTTASASCPMQVNGLPRSNLNPVESFGRCVAEGVTAGSSGGTQLDPGGTANTFPASFTQIVASTAGPTRGMVALLGGRANTARATCRWDLQLAVGGAGSEQVLLYHSLRSTTGVDEIAGQSVYIPCNLPAGVRLSARVACTITDATDRLIDIALYRFQ